MITPEEDQPLTFRACLAALLQTPAHKIYGSRKFFLRMCAKTRSEEELHAYFVLYGEDKPRGWQDPHERKRERKPQPKRKRKPQPEPPPPPPPPPPEPEPEPAQPRKPLGKQQLQMLRLFTALAPEEFRAPKP
jgi:type IV secretory pathway VirB10-like protein